MNIIGLLKQWLLIKRYSVWIWRDKDKRNFLKSIKIMNANETIEYIINNKCSISRYGDGEFYVMAGGQNKFQKTNSYLEKRLQEILLNHHPMLLIGLPYTFKSTRHLTMHSTLFIKEFIYNNISRCCIPYINTAYFYGDSLFTRFYMAHKDKSNHRVNQYISKLKQIWDNKDILIIEGKYSRLGYNNDLFNNANDITRILCPPQNAVDKYEDIYNCALKNATNKIVLLALGMTATVLAYDLCLKGIQAIDIGHIDTEYEWHRMGVKTKVAIKDKLVDEIMDDQHLSESNDNKYNREIIAIIE